MGIILLVLAYNAFSAREKNSPISEGLSDTELALLPSAPEVGALAPDFDLVDADGASFSLTNTRGKPVVLMFFHTW